MQLFSASGLRSLVHDFTPEERHDLDSHALTAQDELSKTCLTEKDRRFFLYVGGPGSGHTEFMQSLARDENLAAVLTEHLKPKFLVTQNAKRRFKSAEKDGTELPEGFVVGQDEQEYALSFAERARIYVARKIANGLHDEDLYRVAYPCNPSSLMRGHLLDELERSQQGLDVKVFSRPLPAMARAAGPQPSGIDPVFKEYSATPNAIRHALELGAKSVEIYWSGTAEMRPVLAARATPDSGFQIVNTEAFRAMERDKQIDMGDKNFSFEKLRTIYAQSHSAGRSPEEALTL